MQLRPRWKGFFPVLPPPLHLPPLPSSPTYPFTISTKANLYVLPQLHAGSLSSLPMPMWILMYLSAFKNSLSFVRKYCLTLEAYVDLKDRQNAVHPMKSAHVYWITNWSCVLFKVLGVIHDQDMLHSSVHPPGYTSLGVPGSVDKICLKQLECPSRKWTPDF